MTEQMLVDLMGGLDISLLENQYIENDLLQQKQKAKRHLFSRKRALRRGRKFEMADSLRTTINEQRELIDNVIANPMEDESIVEKIDMKVNSVKKKVNKAVTIISGIVAMIVVTVSVIGVLIKKKSMAKLMEKRAQSACKLVNG
ncbi:MAG: hypothetical protein PUC65_01215 [Clostridiales bacterium]|nr:hypothetical protein [Clostridiales bacterium]